MHMHTHIPSSIVQQTPTHLPEQLIPSNPVQPLKFLTSRPHIQLMRPQTRLLPMQPQIRLPHRIRTHFLPLPLLLTIFIRNAPVRDRMHDVYAFLAHLTGQGLRELPD